MVLLSILIVSITERYEKMQYLLNRLKGQEEHVQICCIIDNKKQTIGEKRNLLLSMIRGRYFTFLDDDDDIDDSYFDIILNILQENCDVDVITFKQACFLKNQESPCFIVDADMRNGSNEAVPMNGPWKEEYKRLCWHWCLFKSETFRTITFEPCSYYEDILWLQKIYSKIQTQLKIDKTLHKYIFLGDDSQTIDCLKKNLL
jgi:glycosyltransferase involved in cell wall biosynthesis